MNIFKEIHSELTSASIPVTSIISNPISNISLIGSNNQKLIITLKKNICFANSSLVFGDDNNAAIENAQISGLIDRNIENTIAILFQNGNSEKLKSELKKILDCCEKSSTAQLKLERQMMQIFSVFYKFLNFIPEDKLLEIDMEINELISLSYTYKALYEGICFLISRMFKLQKYKNEAKDSNQAIIEKIEAYIKHNYTSPISLQTLSDTFGFVPHYLSRIFKKSMDISPIDLVINLRIEKAKELLQIEPPLSQKYIAEAVGFSDQFYFSKVFKDIVGKPPSEYKNERRS